MKYNSSGGHGGSGGTGYAIAGGGGRGGADTPPQFESFNKQCDACHGTGTVNNEDCWHCGGEGLDPTK